MAIPSVTVEIAFATPPLAATPVWTDVSAFVLAWQTQRGREDELDRIEAGTATITLDNTDRRFDPLYTTGPYFPNVLPVRRVRISAGHRIFSGYIEAWPPDNPGGLAPTVTIRCVDAFKLFASQRLRAITVLDRFPQTALEQNDIFVVPVRHRILRVIGGQAGQTGTVVIAGTGVNGEYIEVSYALNGTTPVNNDTRFNEIYRVLVIPPRTNPGDTVTIVATNRFVAEQSGFAISTMLNVAQWPQADRNIQIGQTLIQGVELPDGTSILSHIQRIVDSENGSFFINGAGFAMFQERWHRLTQVPSTVSHGIFGDSISDQFQYEDIHLVYDDALIANEVTVQREGGVAQQASDPVSQATYFTRSYSETGLLMTTNGEALAAAQWLLLQYKDPRVRVPRVTLSGMMDDDLWPQILERGISERVTIVHRPPGGGGAITIDCYIEAVAHEWRGGDVWRTTWQLSPASANTWFVLDSATQGRLDFNAVAY